MAESLNNVCLLATEHPVCKAYWAKLLDMGLVPAKVIVFQRTGKTVANPGLVLRVRRLAGKIYRKLFQVQPSAGYRWHGSTFETRLFDYCREKSLVVPDYVSPMAKQLKRHPNVQIVNATGINDEEIVNAIAKSRMPYVIYSGGGILRNEILGLPSRMIHVHPGIVPDVKGADGILWSSLLRKKIGMSAFFMNLGIDTGDILARREYEIPAIFDIDDAQVDMLDFASFIVDSIDPIYRAELLGSLFNLHKNPDDWNSDPQDPTAGKTYYFMHDEIKKLVGSQWRLKDSQ